MDWIQRLNEALDYMEAHLSEEMDPGHLAKITGCSAFHFQRMFTCIAGIPLSEYLRRRRMSLAAVDLQNTEARIVDIALKYGYSSPTAFNRAFQGIHGIAPSAARQKGVSVKSYPPIRVQLILKGAEELNYRIEKKDAFRIVGVSHPLYQELEKNFEIVPQMWNQAAADGTVPKLAALMNQAPAGLLGVSACQKSEQWEYFIAAASSAPVPEGMTEYTIPASTWAIFSGGGTGQSIQELERRAVLEWLPGSGYEYGDAPDIEVYLNPDPENARYELWLPVRAV